MKELLYVAMGGGLGAALRYAVGQCFPRSVVEHFPWSTLLVNLVGSFALGVLAFWGTRQTLPAELRLGAGVGVLGALTTFSTFSVEAVFLARAGRWSAAAGFVAANLLLCLGAVALAGWWVARAR